MSIKGKDSDDKEMTALAAAPGSSDNLVVDTKPEQEQEAAGRPPNSSKVLADERTNWVSRILFSWQTPLIRLGYTRPLEQDDMYQLTEPLTAHFNHDLVASRWQDQIKLFIDTHGYAPKPMPVQQSTADAAAAKAATVAAAAASADSAATEGKTEKDGQDNKENEKPAPPEPSPSLVKALWHAYGTPFVYSGILSAISIACQVATPIVLQYLLEFLARETFRLSLPDPVPASTEIVGLGYWLVLAIFVLQVLATVLNTWYVWISMRIGMSVRAALTAIIYSKTMRLSAAARAGEFNAGRVTNVIAADTNRIDIVTPFLHMVWSAPIQVFVILGLLIRLVGVSALAGFGFMLFAIPIQGLAARSLTEYRKDAQLITDKRVKLMNEMVQGSRIIKLMSWEAAATEAIMELRMQELSLVRRLAMWRAGISGFSQAVPALAAIVVFAVYYAVEGKLDTAIVFSALALFNQLRFPLMFIPMVIAFSVDAKVALDRIKAILLAEELETQPEYVASDHPAFTSTAISITDAEFEWTKDNPQLSDINLRIPKGKLVAIVGTVGSGKSSLLSGIVGEMKRTKGSVVISGTMGYCPQQPWIQNATLKDNVLFGLPLDAQRYQRAIRLAALEKDIQQLPGGEMTEIGEKGITLSGGQKARINLARALYYNPEILLLDDPLSAVDAHVGKHLFNTIKNETAGTRVLVTHALHFVPQCDYVVYMRDGHVAEFGTYAELMSVPEGAFATQMRSYGGVGHEAPASASLTASEEEDQADVVADKTQKVSQAVVQDAKAGGDAAKGKLMQSEERATGTVNASIYNSYMSAMGSIATVGLLLAVLILSQLLRVANDLWLTWWIRNSFGLSQGVYLGVYFAWGLAQSASYVLNGIQFAYAGVLASANLHREAVYGVMRSPMSFFDTTPVGRILSRFSKDQDAVDNTLPDAFRMFLGTLTMTLAMFGLMIAATPWFAVPLVPLMVVYWYVQVFYRSTSRELKRLDSVGRSPLYAAFSETLTGITTIRAYREEERFRNVNQTLIDYNNRPYYQSIAAQRWLSIRIETIGSLLVLFAGLFGVINVGITSVELIGLSLSYALQVTGALNWCVRQAAEVEMQMNAVERIWHYASELEAEAPPVTAVRPPSEHWPERGEVEFSNVTLAYRKGLDPVLKNVNMKVPAGSKVGIVGRTGAGKSTTLVALFRLVELMEGKIVIDGVDIAQLGLHDLRSRLAIIPQEPTLFAGTWRSNLDRFGQVSDDKLWESLERAGLKEYVQSLPEKLDAPIDEGGENLSVGQRQLACLARAMTRNSNLIVLDEVTASVDLESDAQIQRAIRRDFGHATILTIAHRLNTIIDYDYIAVFSAGEMIEFAPPNELLQRPDSLFTALVEETGPQNAALLRRLAAEKRIEL
ncbi:P-loop containing nucleoside triphosphate hydrolase protein [Catenaria anguillulae PL171]|uniref:p-loop containing nucleoside triphosphate hydrolase protein n=1 Tax=Catenaria anguillulae PL171 TaxID=765915 RepID=A0A1Y2HFZ0_9FUNG|nr:P-loop containing nucleoside triphosphate hydrolase protein [Catenaria anguillulae PL171]